MSDSVKRALRTAAQAFLGVFAVALLGWAGEVASWAGCDVPSLGALEARFGPAIPVNEKTVNAFPWDQRNVIKAQA